MTLLLYQLMLREAERLVADAQYLRGKVNAESNGAYLLELLALEILLKCAPLETGSLDTVIMTSTFSFLRLESGAEAGDR